MIDDYYGHVIATVEGTVEAQNVVSFLSLQRGPVPMPEDDKGMGAEEWGQRNGDKGMGTKEWGQERPNLLIQVLSHSGLMKMSPS